MPNFHNTYVCPFLGGTAGVVVATRLSENRNIRVGLIEAGLFRDNDPKIDSPAIFGQSLGDPNYDWMYSTIPQPGLNGRTIPEPRSVPYMSLLLESYVYVNMASLEGKFWVDQAR
jgi:hypothetical protein